MAKLTFLGHATLLVASHGHHVLVDPFITGNPQYPQGFSLPKVDAILLTHYHSDHLGDTKDLAKQHDALVVTTAEIAGQLEQEGVKVRPMHIGGRASFPFGEVKLVPAVHGSGIAGGLPCGFVLTVEGKKLYFAGDTALFSDMRLIGERYGPIEVAALPIGSNFTMDVQDAIWAATLIRPRTVLPIHYNTWPLITADPNEMTEPLRREGIGVAILKPGESLDL